MQHYAGLGLTRACFPPAPPAPIAAPAASAAARTLQITELAAARSIVLATIGPESAESARRRVPRALIRSRATFPLALSDLPAGSTARAEVGFSPPPSSTPSPPLFCCCCPCLRRLCLRYF